MSAGVVQVMTCFCATYRSGRALIFCSSAESSSRARFWPNTGSSPCVGYADLITISDKCCTTNSKISGWPHHQVCTEGNFNSSPRRYRHTAGRKGRKPGACRTPQPTALATATLPRKKTHKYNTKPPPPDKKKKRKR